MTDHDFNLKATGNVTGCRFVKIDTTSDGDCAAAGANEGTIGISQEGTRNAPGTAADDGFLAIAGETVPIYGPGRKCLLELGGTVARGARIKAGSAGVGITSAVTGTTVQEIGARALQSGVSGQKILVLIEMYPYLPAVA